MSKDHISLCFLPKHMRKSLTNFQKKGIQFGIRKNGRVLIGDEMGLGKTLQAVAIAYYYFSKWPLLIIAPSSLRYNWVNELENWLPFLQPGDINMIRSFADINQMACSKVTIISYGLISISHGFKNVKVSELIAKSNFGIVIVDESHYLKNMKAIRTKEILNSLKGIAHIIMLSGTPSLSRPEELYPQLHLLQPTIFSNFHQFGERFCGGYFEAVRARGGQIYNTFQTRGASNLDELNSLLKNIMIRRLKNQVLQELPSKRRSKIIFEIPDSNKYKKGICEQFEVIRKVLKQIKNPENGFIASAFDYNQPFNKLFCDTALAKAGAVQKYICDLLEGMPNKFLVFCFHMTMVKAIQEILAQKKVKYICITGSVPSTERGHLVERFQSERECKVAVLSIQAASTGLTLTAADHVVFAELHHTPGILLQAEDRCHRIGQKNAVQIHYLLAQGTIDEILWTMLQRKVMVTTAALNGKISELSMDENDYSKKALLSIVDTWEPLHTTSTETSQLFEEKQKACHSKDIRSFFNIKSECEKGKKRKKALTFCIDLCSDGEDFKSPKKKKKVFAINQPKSLQTSESSCVCLLDNNQTKKPSVVTAVENQVISKTDLTTPNEECKKHCPLGKKVEGKSNLVVEYEVEATTLKDFNVSTHLQSLNTNNPLLINSLSVNKQSLPHQMFHTKLIEGDILHDEDLSLDLIKSAKDQSCLSYVEEQVEGVRQNLDNEIVKQTMSSIELDNSDDNFMKHGVYNGSAYSSSDLNVNQDKKTENDDNNYQQNLFMENFKTYNCISLIEDVSAADEKLLSSDSLTVCSSDKFAFGNPSNVLLLKSSTEILSVKANINGVLSNTRSAIDNNEKCSQWSCSSCTYLNHSELKACEICLNKRNDNLYKDKSKIICSRKSGGKYIGMDLSLYSSDEKIPVSPVNFSLNHVADKQTYDSAINLALNLKVDKETSSSGSNLHSSKLVDKGSSNEINESIEMLFSSSQDVLNKDSDSNDQLKNISLEKSFVGNNSFSVSFSGEDSILVEEDRVNEFFKNDSTGIDKVAEKITFTTNQHLSQSSSLMQSANDTLVKEGLDLFFDDDFIIDDQLVTNNQTFISDNDSEISEDELNNLCHSFKFQMSFYTNKVYLFDYEEKYLQLNFNFQNFSMGIIDDLHPTLLLDHHFKQLKNFTKEWKSLGPRKQLLVTKKGLIFSSPLEAYAAIYNKNNGEVKSFKRFTDKKNSNKVEKNAKNAGGKVIAIKRLLNDIFLTRRIKEEE